MTLHDQFRSAAPPTTPPALQVPPAALALLRVSDARLARLLAEHGEDVAAMGGPARAVLRAPGGPVGDDAEVIPLGDGWYRCDVEDDGALRVLRVDHPLATTSGDAPFTIRAPRVPELPGWVPRRLDLDARARWWLRIMQQPGRESYAAVVQHRAAEAPELVVIGTYPDAILAEGPALAFVEPHPQDPTRARARLVPVVDPPQDGSFPVLAEGPAGTVRILPTSVRRYLKVAGGVRSARVWRLVDTAQDHPYPADLPVPAGDPDLVDVAMVEGRATAVHAVNDGGAWSLYTAPLTNGSVTSPGRVVAAGPGRARGVAGGRDGALLRWSLGAEEHLGLVRLPRPDASGVPPLLRTAGTFSLQLNTCANGAGFAVPELVIGAAPRSWFLDHAGTLLNAAPREASRVRSTRETLASADGTPVVLEARWRGGDTFAGPTVLMVYGAYGTDLDLDTDPELRHWLDRGFAVATAHVRGGGGDRHREGYREHREASVQDTIAAARWLRAGRGAVRASRLCVVGASAGGFLAASLVARRVDAVDAAVVVNGYVDPLLALSTNWSRTRAADVDEWGDPAIPAERDALVALSPLRRLTAPGAPVLVVVSVRDARVDPRLGLAWVTRYREVGGTATLWYDLQGTHEAWGTHLGAEVMIDWVDAALAGTGRT